MVGSGQRNVLRGQGSGSTTAIQCPKPQEKLAALLSNLLQWCRVERDGTSRFLSSKLGLSKWSHHEIPQSDSNSCAKPHLCSCPVSSITCKARPVTACIPSPVRESRACQSGKISTWCSTRSRDVSLAGLRAPAAGETFKCPRSTAHPNNLLKSACSRLAEIGAPSSIFISKRNHEVATCYILREQQTKPGNTSPSSWRASAAHVRFWSLAYLSINS